MKKLFSTSYSDVSFNLAMLLLRVIAGATMIPHGYGKLKNFSKMSTAFADPFHLGMKVSLCLTIFAEFFCAMLIILGLFTRLASIPLIVVMSVALFSAHKGEIFGDGGMAGLYLSIFGAILLVGPGRASVDGMIGK
ncbi:MAG: DoxX family protein [Chitinophagaceae bacterium]|jgi:putative oxidoreductase|nr:DoxX family protein [Sphingobacteriales bacterium]OJW03796.1 MAG: hypothetical protein BGO52_16645 [Sphingobacteriales bacterium 44-61]TXJ23677.1 MAG: DoxX family protein [Chitinophagaceae bacterium]